MNKLVPATSLSWALKKSRDYDYDYDYDYTKAWTKVVKIEGETERRMALRRLK